MLRGKACTRLAAGLTTHDILWLKTDTARDWMRMKVHLTNCGETELISLMTSRAANPSSHQLVDSPEDADLILMLGSFGRDPELLLDHPLYQKFRISALFTPRTITTSHSRPGSTVLHMTTKVPGSAASSATPT